MSERHITVDVDNTAQAAYITLSDSPVARTLEVTDSVLIDLDEMNLMVGVEVLELGAEIPFSKLVSDYHVHSDVIELLRRVQPSVAGFLFTHSAEGVAPANAPQAVAAGA